MLKNGSVSDYLTSLVTKPTLVKTIVQSAQKIKKSYFVQKGEN
jgi:hypothetical protein